MCEAIFSLLFFCPLRNPSQILFPSKSHSYKPGFLVRCHIVLALNLGKYNGGKEIPPTALKNTASVTKAFFESLNFLVENVEKIVKKGQNCVKKVKIHNTIAHCHIFFVTKPLLVAQK